jgi:predicted TIM-barrel fold metal-dependent hydrolase
MISLDYWVKLSIADIILTGVFDRYPKLQVGAVEHELSWIPHFLERMQYRYLERIDGRGGYRLQGDMLPTDYFHRNIFVGFQADGLGIKLRDIIGVDQLLWGNDYPHRESTFPRSRQIIAEILADCTEEERVKIAGGNAARVYSL